jgi:hypothetical protein
MIYRNPLPPRRSNGGILKPTRNLAYGSHSLILRLARGIRTNPIFLVRVKIG